MKKKLVTIMAGTLTAFVVLAGITAKNVTTTVKTTVVTVADVNDSSGIGDEDVPL